MTLTPLNKHPDFVTRRGFIAAAAALSGPAPLGLTGAAVGAPRAAPGSDVTPVPRDGAFDLFADRTSLSAAGRPTASAVTVNGESAPYMGVRYGLLTGKTADIARRNGVENHDPPRLFGVRLAF